MTFLLISFISLLYMALIVGFCWLKPLEHGDIYSLIMETVAIMQ